MCLIMSISTDRIGQHEGLSPVNHNYNKFVIFKAFLQLKHKKFREQ